MRISSLLLSVAAALLLTHPALANDQAVVLSSEGSVQIDGRTPSPGETIAEGSRILSGPDGSLSIGLEGTHAGSSLVIEPSSEMRVGDLGENGRLDLDSGSVFLKLTHSKKSHFQVSTPTAVATVRGTGWYQTPSTVAVYEGTVEVSAPDGSSESLSSDEAVDITGQGLIRHEADPSGRDLWMEKIGQAEASPYFGRIRASDVLRIRQRIDEKRSESACGSLGPRAWKSSVAEEASVGSDALQEIKDALNEAPFAGREDFIRRYVDRIPDIRPGSRTSGELLRLLLEAAENADC